MPQHPFNPSTILDSKLVRIRLFYLVDWVGYESERSWEPADNMENAADAVADFHATFPARPAHRLPHRVPRLEGGVLLGPSLQSLGFPSEVSTVSARALLAQFPL